MALLVCVAVMASAPAMARGTGICNASGTLCSVYAYADDGAEYISNAPDGSLISSEVFHIEYSMGHWRALAIDPTYTFDVIWGPASPDVTPFAGDWDGTGNEGVGIAYPFNGMTRFVTANLHTAVGGTPGIYTRPGFYDVPALGMPLIGDWDGDGIDSVGVYNNGVFTLVNNPVAGRPSAPMIMDLSALLPATDAELVQPITWPWMTPQDGTDFIGLALPDTVIAVDRYWSDYVHGVSPRPMAFVELPVDYTYPERPVVLEGKDPAQPLVGGYISPPSHQNPEQGSTGIRPDLAGDWTP